MFPEINPYEKYPEIKLFLCNSRKEVIGKIKHHSNPNLQINAGKLNELSFNVPLFIDEKETGLEVNQQSYKLKEKVIVKVKYNNWEEFFTIDSKTDSKDDRTRNIHAFSLGYQLDSKSLKNYKSKVTVSSTDPETGELITAEVEGSIDIQKAMNDALQKHRNWSVGYISPSLLNVYRSFDFDSVTGLQYLFEIGTKFNALLTWDTINNKVNAYHVDEYGENKGLKISDKNYIESISRQSSDDELVSRLYLYGKDGLTINEVNPTGVSYIDDFRYFMYPFQSIRKWEQIKDKKWSEL